MEWLDEIEQSLPTHGWYYYRRIAKLIAAVRVAEKALSEISRYAPNGDKGDGEYAWTVGLIGWDALAQLQSGEFGEVDGE